MRKIKKGDEVIVIAGKDKGRKGAVLSVLQSGKKLVIEGVNIAKKHVRPNPSTGQKGGIVMETHPIDGSNVMLYNAASGKGERVGIKVLADGRKARYFKSTNELVDA